MKDIIIDKNNVCDVEAHKARKPYFSPYAEVVDVECGVSLLAGSGEIPQPKVDDDDAAWADDDCGML